MLFNIVSSINNFVCTNPEFLESQLYLSAEIIVFVNVFENDVNRTKS